MNAEALPFGVVDEIFYHAQRKSPAFAKMSLQEFSRYANQATGSQAFDAGLSGTVGTAIKRTSTALDEFIEPATRPLGQYTYEKLRPLVGEEAAQSGGAAMQGLPRGAAQVIPVFGLAAGGPVSVGTAIAGTLGLAGVGAQAYTETGSPLAGLISAGSTALMPTGAKLGSQVASKLLGPVGQAAENVIGRAGARALERVGEYAGANLGAIGASEVGGELSSLASGQGLYNPLAKERLVATAVTQLPFMAWDAPQLIRGYKPVGGPEGATPKPVVSRTSWSLHRFHRSRSGIACSRRRSWSMRPLDVPQRRRRGPVWQLRR